MTMSADRPGDRQAPAREYWTQAPGRGSLRTVPMPRPGEGEVLIQTLVSGISSGTETLVHRGEVPPRIQPLMAAPHQLGELPHPVSHGYLNVGTVRQGPAELVGERVFTLAGHRSHHVVPVDACHVLAKKTPAERALLAGIAEVGLNAIWEAQVTLGDRVAVVGSGLVGLSTALLLTTLSLSRLQVVDTDPSRRALAAECGLEAVTPEEAAADNDVVVHTSAREPGLARALEITGDDGVVVELSWYGQREPAVPLGADFHARRLRLIGSQVGEVATPKRHRRTRGQRLGLALNLLDERFDALITGHSALARLPATMDELAAGSDWARGQLLHVVTYDDEGEHR